jgi:hypothetical protein
MHEEVGLQDPAVLKNYEVKLLLLALQKRLGTAVKRRTPLNPGLLYQLYAKLSPGSTNDMVVWAIVLLCFFGLLRISNLLPPSVDGFDVAKHLSRHAFMFCEDYIVLSLLWAKNNQTKARVVHVPIPRVCGSVLCPVTATVNAFQLTQGGCSEGPAFLRVGKGGRLKPVLYSWFSKKLLGLIEACGLNRDEFGTHSLRRGGACWALKCGFNSEVIKILGDWHSDAYQCYLEIPLRDKLIHMKKFASCVEVE